MYHRKAELLDDRSGHRRLHHVCERQRGLGGFVRIDVLLGVPSSGVHSNGYTLARKATNDAAAYIEELAILRDRALVLAGTTTDLQAGFRGVVAEARKGRTGLLLSPEGALDGDLLGVRLPRSLAVPGPRGRGVLVVRGALTAVQVPFLDPTQPA